MFFKKNKKKETSSMANGEDTRKLDKRELIDEAEDLINTIDSVSGDERIEVLNRIGSLYFEANKIDDAIKYYEISISENKSLGKAYTELVKLYNIKRKEAISKKDDESMKQYMEKIDRLLQLSKDVIRGRG
ncbi:tetratricopeptide repeat protein [Thermoanaerobacterium sp. CMT5567-10]|uniref:tetratricopeptide repeat protein n=1 Tax=Thermoanaerobacterium sp. CMT5567-10 TaxID=3061989 RepID=UPI0026E01B07|nr:tetratricopeptide repeat protein [Thermoanaerobacterium sp. CMT5567-10]WKV10173.1 tetratricopeptide repeat protein [Thermoanaerobacterium sp. CMT5567-10]